MSDIEPGDTLPEIKGVSVNGVTVLDEDGSRDMIMLTLADADGECVSVAFDPALIRSVASTILRVMNERGMGYQQLDVDPTLN